MVRRKTSNGGTMREFYNIKELDTKKIECYKLPGTLCKQGDVIEIKYCDVFYKAIMINDSECVIIGKLE